MADITLKWFFEIPGLFITLGVLLILVAALIFIFSSEKNKKKKEVEEEPQIGEKRTVLEVTEPVTTSVVNETTPAEDPVAVVSPVVTPVTITPVENASVANEIPSVTPVTVAPVNVENASFTPIPVVPEQVVTPQPEEINVAPIPVEPVIINPMEIQVPTPQEVPKEDVEEII